MAYSRFFLALILLAPSQIWGQQTITFSADDGVTITADHYVVSTQKPYLILLHQAGYSRGEYRETAPKLANLGFNCLAVDLRSGGEVNFIKNQTALDAKAKGLPAEHIDAKADIIAALEFVANRSSKPIIIVGSSYSASLALAEASENFKIKAVVAFSPGEYFGKKLNIKQSTQNLYVPVLALSTRLEYDEMKKMLDHINTKHLNLFRPINGEGIHGSRALWERNETNDQYWLALTQFFSQINLK